MPNDAPVSRPPAESPPPPGSKLFEQLTAFQIARPGTVLAVVFVVTAIATFFAARLKLLTGFENLLPQERPSVVELNRVGARTAGLSTVFVVLEGQDPEGIRKAVDELVPALQALGQPWVGQAESGVQVAKAFLEPRAGLFVPLDTLQSLHDEVEARFEYEVAKESGTLVDDEEPPPPLDAEKLKKRLGTDKLDAAGQFPGGRYQSRDGKTAVIVLRSGVLATDLSKGQECLARIQAAIARLNPYKHDAHLKVGLSGDLGVGIAEFKLIKKDLTEIGLLGVGLVLGVVLLYYLRLRTTVAMSLTIGIGVGWTFGVTQLLVGHLNIATGFMFTIVAGNGINFSIMFMDRYLEERRKAVPVSRAISVSAVSTWQPTLTAALSAGAAYGALVITEFKGFKEFGYIGGLGMLLCWVATFAALPSILVLMEKLAPLDTPPPKWLGAVGRRIEAGIPFGRPFAAVVARAPGLVAAVGVVLTLVGATLTYLYATSDPMEYDTNKIQSDRSQNAEIHRLMGVGIHTTGYIGLDGMAILVDRLDQVAPLKQALEARRDAAPADQKPFKAVYSLQDFVPPDQEAKVPLLMKLKKRVTRARELGSVTDKDWAELEPFLPPDGLKPFGLDDLPEAVARLFTENDGTRGRVVYISPLSEPQDITSDAHYLLRWADSFRRTELPDKSVVLGSGRAVIYADMWDAVISDIPKAILVSFLATLAIVALAFRRGGATLRVLFTMLAGVLWMVGLLAAAKVKLNFLNFVALPLTFGIGVDYAVNMTQRDLELGDSVEVLKKTGGAVILCSLTTLLGYLALVGSINFGVRSMGTSAVLGEVTCLLAAILALPAATTWWRRRKETAAAALAGPPTSPAPKPTDEPKPRPTGTEASPP